jgi:hypothetical protein
MGRAGAVCRGALVADEQPALTCEKAPAKLQPARGFSGFLAYLVLPDLMMALVLYQLDQHALVAVLGV